MQKLLGVMVKFDDGDVLYTRFNGNPKEASEYYVGGIFNFGECGGPEVKKTCTGIETYE